MVIPPFKDVKQYLLVRGNSPEWFNKNGTVKKKYKIYASISKDLNIFFGTCTSSKRCLYYPDEIAYHFFKDKFEMLNLNEEQYYEICRTLEKKYKEYLVEEKLNNLQKDFE